jgi:hypothetical protein
MSLNPFRSFGTRVAALTTAGVVGAYALGAFPAAAQQAFKCEDAVKIANGIVRDYKGKLSPDFIRSFVRFSDSNCDLQTTFSRVDGTSDEQAFKEFRVRLVALRKTADAAQSRGSLAKN